MYRFKTTTETKLGVHYLVTEDLGDHQENRGQYIQNQHQLFHAAYS